MSTEQPTLVEELGAALREVRWRRRLSQRQLAEQLGVSKTWVARLESGDVSAAVAAVSRLVVDLGLRLAVGVDDHVVAPRGADAADRRAHACVGDPVGDETVADPTVADPTTTTTTVGASAADASAAGGRVRSRSGYTTDPEAVALVGRWRERVERERVRDAAGRRLPAHLVAYPMSYPHHWWFLRHRGWSLRRRPIWSFVRGLPSARPVLQIGDNPPPLGLHPEGGWPMQGHPGPEIRAQWPPTFPYRPRRYADPLSAA